MVQEAKFPVKNLVRQRCAEGFNSVVKGLNHIFVVSEYLFHQLLDDTVSRNVTLCIREPVFYRQCCISH
jgi:hypothetical protein